jgi:antitoxin component YwqK of YwqJK toxin-antitoxin module
MWKLLIIPLLAFSLQAAAQSDTLNRTDDRKRKTGYWISRDASGLKVYEGNFREGRPYGKFIRYHANGKVRAEMNYQPDGVRVDARLYDPDGHLRAQGTYVNQIKDGLWQFYSEKNNPVYKINYLNGRVNGEALRYDANGGLLEQTLWKDNILNGLQTTYYPENKPQAKINYRDGIIDGPYELLFPDGTAEVKGVYSAGLKVGDWVYFKAGGETDFILKYQNGKLLNPEILDARQREAFERYEKNRNLLKDPQDFLNNPEGLLIR